MESKYTLLPKKKSVGVLWEAPGKKGQGREIACFKTREEAKAFIRGIQFQNGIVTHLAKSL